MSTNFSRNSHVLLGLFVGSLLIPVYYYLGSLRLTPYRVYLLISILPLLTLYSIRRLPGLKACDVLVFGICLWTALSFSVVHGLSESWEASGMFFVETFGSYMVGRVLVRSQYDFLFVVNLLFLIALVVLPFAVVETYLGINVFELFFSKIGSTYPNGFMDPRWGLERVQGPFPHPIHFGVFFLSLLGLVVYVRGFGFGLARRLRLMATVVFVGGLSLSSGPLVALMVQVIAIVWDLVFGKFKGRWISFAILVLFAYVAIDVLSNRTPFHVIIEYLSFNKETAYNRINIWNAALPNIFDNPWFGLGFKDWARPVWQSASIDMFWVVPAVRHGVVAWVLWFGFFFFIFFGVAQRKILDLKVSQYRTGYLITLGGLFCCGWTVHFWEITYVFFVFILGAGVWFLDFEDRASNELTRESAKQEVSYSRFTR